LYIERNNTEKGIIPDIEIIVKYLLLNKKKMQMSWIIEKSTKFVNENKL